MKNIKEHTKELILTTMEEKLLTHNFKSISIDSIAKELRISKRTIYEIFESKEHILEIAIDRYQQNCINYADTVALKIQKGELSFTDGICDVMKFLSEKTMFSSELFTLLPEKAKRVDTKKKNIFMKFYDIAMEQGLVKKEISKDVYFMVIRTCILAMHNPKIKRDYNISDNQSIADFMDIIH